jgi:di/tricarboxylate transporter
MTPDIIITLGTILVALGLLASNRFPADATLMAALAVLVLTHVISPTDALLGFANTGLMTIALLYVLAAALRDTGAIYWLAHRLLGHPKSQRGSLVRLLIPSSLLSAFLNNTTVVAMMIPAVQEWAQRLKVPASRLLLPLSYAAILGGTTTLIGTSTNLVVDGLMHKEGMAGFRLFDLAWVGVPLLIVCSAFLIFFGRWLLPDREGLVEQMEQAREYRVEMLIPDGSPLAGKTITAAGLRSLAYGYLTEVFRDEHLYSPVSPDLQLQQGDRLIFVGPPASARELQRINGLQAAYGDAEKLGLRHEQRCLVEVVLAPDFPHVGKTVKQSAFRTHYQAAILCISRNGVRLEGNVGDELMKSGDTLLLETSDQFVEQYRYRRDFLLVSPLKDSAPPDFRKAPLAVGILVGMVLLNVLDVMSVLESVFVAGGAMLLTGCVSVNRARQMVSINLPVLTVIGASFALGAAMQQSGTAQYIVDALFPKDTQMSPWMVLLIIYVLTALFTEVITNNAAAVLMFPIGLGAAMQLDVSPLPYMMAIMFGASASFMTPIGYQTNLMVMGPGGYRFSDYLRVGIPISVVAGVVTVGLIPWVWPF